MYFSLRYILPVCPNKSFNGKTLISWSNSCLNDFYAKVTLNSIFALLQGRMHGLKRKSSLFLFSFQNDHFKPTEEMFSYS